MPPRSKIWLADALKALNAIGAADTTSRRQVAQILGFTGSLLDVEPTPVSAASAVQPDRSPHHETAVPDGKPLEPLEEPRTPTPDPTPRAAKTTLSADVASSSRLPEAAGDV